MKKLFALIVAICATTLAWADDSGSCGENVTYSFVSSTGTLTISGTGAMKDYILGGPWDAYRSSIKNIVINNGVTSIGKWAFYTCGMTSVTIPNSVTTIGENAFKGCYGLTSVTIPNSVTTIGENVFADCGMTSVTIPNSVTSIGKMAFYNCDDLTSITIPNSVTSIAEEAFYGCSGLTSVTIPNSVTSIGKSAFWYCTGLTSVTIGDGVTSIESGTFRNCSGLTNITIPNSVTSIGGMAFNDCTGLTSVTIPNSVTSIGDMAFERCYRLTSINIAEDNLNYASIDGVLYSKDKKTLITCPEGKTGSVNIPNSVTTIEKYAFRDCKSLTSINVAEDNLNYASIDGVLYSKDKKTLITCPGGKTGSVTIPNSVTTIESNAFRYCTGLTSVTIGNSVTSIGNSAFMYCTGLTSMTVEATNPPYYSSTYDIVSKYYIPLYVPAGSVDAYKAADEWKKFTNIQAIPATGVKEATAEKSAMKKIIDRNGIIYIEKDGTRYFLNGDKVE